MDVEVSQSSLTYSSISDNDRLERLIVCYLLDRATFHCWCLLYYSILSCHAHDIPQVVNVAITIHCLRSPRCRFISWNGKHITSSFHFLRGIDARLAVPFLRLVEV